MNCLNNHKSIKPCSSKNVNNNKEDNLVNSELAFGPVKLMEIDFTSTKNNKNTDDKAITKVIFDSDSDRAVELIRNDNTISAINQNQTYTNLSKYFTLLNKRIDKQYKINTKSDQKNIPNDNKIKKNKNGIRYDLDSNNNKILKDQINNHNHLKEENLSNSNEFITNKLPNINNMTELNYLYREYLINGRIVHLQDELKHQKQNSTNDNNSNHNNDCLDFSLHECFSDICKRTPLKFINKLKSFFSQIQLLHQHINSGLTSKLSDSFELIHEHNRSMTFDCMKLIEIQENKSNKSTQQFKKPIKPTASNHQNELFPIPNDYIRGIPDDMINMFNVKEIIENIQKIDGNNNNNNNNNNTIKNKIKSRDKQIPKNNPINKSDEEQVKPKQTVTIDSRQENRLNNLIKLILKISNEINEMNLYQLNYLLKQSSRLYCMQKSSSFNENDDSNLNGRKKKLESYQNFLNHRMKKIKPYLFKSADENDENDENFIKIYNYLKDQINGFINVNDDKNNIINDLIDSYFIIKQLYEFDFSLKMKECDEVSIFNELNNFKLCIFDLFHDILINRYQTNNNDENKQKSFDEYFSVVLKPITIELMSECIHLDQKPQDPRLLKSINKNTNETIDFGLFDYKKNVVINYENLNELPYNEKLYIKSKYKMRLKNLSLHERPKTPELINNQDQIYNTPNKTVENSEKEPCLNMSLLSVPPTPGANYFLHDSTPMSKESKDQYCANLTHSESLDDIFNLKKLLEEEQEDIMKNLDHNQTENNFENANLTNSKDVLVNISNNNEFQLAPPEILKNTDSNNNDVLKENNPNQDEILNKSSFLSEKEEKLPHILDSLKKIQENLSKSKDNADSDQQDKNQNHLELLDLFDYDNQNNQTDQDLDSFLLNTKQDSFLSNATSKSFDLNLMNKSLFSVINENLTIANRSPIIDINLDHINDKNNLNKIKKSKNVEIRSCNSTPFKKLKTEHHSPSRFRSHSLENTIDSNFFEFKDLRASSPLPSFKRSRSNDKEKTKSRSPSESREIKKRRSSCQSRSSSISLHNNNELNNDKNNQDDGQAESFQFRPEQMQIQLAHYFNNFRFNPNNHLMLTDNNQNKTNNSDCLENDKSKISTITNAGENETPF